MSKFPIDGIFFGVPVVRFLPEVDEKDITPGAKVSGNGLTLEITTQGYKVVKEWDEEQDLVDSALMTREKRHVWELTFFSSDGVSLGECFMSTAWEVVPVDVSTLPAGWKEPARPNNPKPQPFVTMSVPSKVK